jgi:CRISPR-associated protein Csd1
MQIYERNVREQLLFVSCAATRKYHYDKYKEVWSMSLEEKSADRSYQFGRLIAIFEKIERDTYSDNEERETNAVRMLPMFSQRPMETTRKVYEQLERAYVSRLRPSSREYYSKLIGQIMEQLSNTPDNEINKPLADTYLFGYYLQRNELYKSRKNTVTQNDLEMEEE